MDITARDQIIHNWLIERTKLAETKNVEMALRKQVTEILFPNPTKGTQRFALDNIGTNIKLVYKLNHKLGFDNAVDDNGVKIRKDDQIFELQRRMEAVSEDNLATLLADRLIKWSAELSVTEYEKLDVNDPIQRKLKDMIDDMLTVEPAVPSLEFEEPKVK